jgi:hypothetical protein
MEPTLWRGGGKHNKNQERANKADATAIAAILRQEVLDAL